MSRRPRPKDPVAAAEYYAAEARAAANPYEQTMQLSPEAMDNLLVLTSDGPPRVKGKSIINTATRGDEDKQRIATPWAFIHALEQRFGTPVDFDLAADEVNAKAPGLRWWGTKHDALKQSWGMEIGNGLGPGGAQQVGRYITRLAFLNPPFAHIKPWALGPKDNPKAGMLSCRWLPRWTVMLVPASYSTDWFLELAGKVQRCAIPRIQFEGQTHLYPKDLVLIVAGFGVAGNSYWDWRVSYLQWCDDHDVKPDPVHAKGCSALIKSGGVHSCLPDFANSPDPFRTATP